MKKLFFALVILMGTLTVQAYDYPYLTFQSADGTTKTIGVESLVITFSGSQLMVTTADDSQMLALSDLSKMFFSATGNTTGIQKLSADSDAVEVFALGGHSVGRFASEAEAKAALKSGIYLMKGKNRTVKIAVK